jgi:hypothetical protein
MCRVHNRSHALYNHNRAPHNRNRVHNHSHALYNRNRAQHNRNRAHNHSRVHNHSHAQRNRNHSSKHSDPESPVIRKDHRPGRAKRRTITVAAVPKAKARSRKE